MPGEGGGWERLAGKPLRWDLGELGWRSLRGRVIKGDVDRVWPGEEETFRSNKSGTFFGDLICVDVDRL